MSSAHATPLVYWRVGTIPHYDGWFVIKYSGGYPKDSSRMYATRKEADAALLNVPAMDYGQG